MEKAPIHHHKKKIKRIKKPKVIEEKEEVIEVNDDVLKDDTPLEDINVEDEIELIFQKIKKEKQNKKALESAKAESAKKPREKGRKYTEDGLPIFTEDELQMNNPLAGTTPLCPFDCQCCH